MTPKLILALCCALGVLCGSMLFAQTTVPERFKQLDKNNDGTLTRNEVPDAAAFTAADSNKDGGVTVEEYRRYNSIESAFCRKRLQLISTEREGYFGRHQPLALPPRRKDHRAA